MTDPLEDRLRSHFADRAAQVSVDPDPAAVVERSAGRHRWGTPLVAGVVGAVVLLAGGSFATGVAVAGSRTARNGPDAAAAPTNGSPTTTVVGGAGVAMPSTGELSGLTPLFLRTSGSGVAIRAYTSSTVPVTVVPPTRPCPAGALCAQPVTSPGSVAGSTGSGAAGNSGGASAGTGATSGPVTVPTTTTAPGSATTNTTTTTTTASTDPPVSTCQQLTVELSTAQAVYATSVASPTTAGLAPRSVQLVDTGSFGEAEGAPAGFAVVAVSADVTTVRLVSAGGAVLDSMAPSSGVAVLATTGATGLGGTSVVGVDATGGVVATVAVDQGTSSSAGCGTTAPVPVPPTTVPPTTVPQGTSPGGTVPSTTVPPTAVPDGTAASSASAGRTG